MGLCEEMQSTKTISFLFPSLFMIYLSSQRTNLLFWNPTFLDWQFCPRSTIFSFQSSQWTKSSQMYNILSYFDSNFITIWEEIHLNWLSNDSFCYPRSYSSLLFRVKAKSLHCNRNARDAGTIANPIKYSVQFARRTAKEHQTKSVIFLLKC